MHVVIATGLYPPEIGGPATFAVFLEKKFTEHGISYTTVPFGKVRHLPKVIRHIAYFARMFNAIRSDSIVLALDPVSVGLPSLFAARLRGASFFLRTGGDYAWEQAVQRWGFEGTPEEFPGSARLPMNAKFLVWTERYVARHSKKVLTQSGHLESIVARWGIEREKISVIPNSISLPRIPAREEARKQLGFKDEPIIVSSGRFVPWKGFDVVIDAYRRVQAEFQNARLVLAGDGPEAPALALRGPKVEFPGSLPKEKLFMLLRAADVFVLNTRYEGFSHQLLEAMAVGVPVVTTDIEGNKDLAENENTALVVPFNDTNALAIAIRRILCDRQLAERLAKSAMEHVRQFTPERTFAEVCRSLDISIAR